MMKSKIIGAHGSNTIDDKNVRVDIFNRIGAYGV